MAHTPLIATVVIGLVLAFLLGALANRLHVSPLVGYLLAGVAIGPHTPGFVADQALARDLADIGVILLMFGVGLQFSPKELLSVKGIAIPGALLQIVATTAFGTALGLALGWPAATALVFGLALSVASTVVVIRILNDRRLIDSQAGHISVGWLIVEDLMMIFVIVLLPTLAEIAGQGGPSADPAVVLSDPEVLTSVGIRLGLVITFIAVMLVVGQRVIPWFLHHIAHTGSRELFRLGLLALALGVAYGAAELVGVSFALGAFFAGLVLSESELSQRAAAESLPLRDAFAVLFFVSVGMLFDPAIFVREPWSVIGVLLVVIGVKPAAALLAMRAFRYPLGTSLTVAASRTQIGEFSFILAGIGVGLGLLPEEGRDLILAGAMLSIVATPTIFIAFERVRSRYTDGKAPARGPATEARAAATAPSDQSAAQREGHAVVIGCGRVGSVICKGLGRAGEPVLVVEERRELVEQLRETGLETVYGHAPAQDVMRAANLALARRLFIAVPDGFEAGQIAQQARAVNPGLQIIARAHSDAEADHLRKYGADVTVIAERELADAMLARAFETREPGAGPGRAAPHGREADDEDADAPGSSSRQ